MGVPWNQPIFPLTGCQSQESTDGRGVGPQTTLFANTSQEGIQGLGPGKKASSIGWLPQSCVGNFVFCTVMLRGVGLARYGGT